MIPEIANILVYDTRRNLTLTVVTKNVPGKSSEWAALMRHNFYTDENAPLPNAPFFLLALADHFYLWKNVENRGEVKPTYNMNPLFAIEPYFDKTHHSLADLNRESFELVVGFWLSSITLAYEKNDICTAEPRWRSEPNHEWLFGSGLFDAIKRGRIERL
jgi:hypothetical protein